MSVSAGIEKKSELIVRVFTLALTLTLFKWCHQESNRGHMDFQSIALPTELWHLLFGLQIYISNLSKQNFNIKKIKFLSADFKIPKSHQIIQT